MTPAPHSADQFTASRDLWWHDDYLTLIARRLGLAGCRRILELGAGVGHWSARLVDMCAPDAHLTLTDREPEWVARLAARFAGNPRVATGRLDVGELSSFQGRFDLVSCQTLLMHLRDVPAVLRAMHGRLVPGGLVLLSEPNNHLSRLPATTAVDTMSPSEYGRLAEMWWAYEIGRQGAALGSELVADALPGMLTSAGFEAIDVFINDRSFAVFPPYDRPEQAGTGQARALEEIDAEKAETRRLALAGGLRVEAFEAAWALYLQHEARVSAARQAGTLSSAGGVGPHYLFSARRPR